MKLSKPVLVDTGPILALYNSGDPAHQVCYDVFDALPFGKAYTCWPVVTEAMYMLRKQRSQQQDLFRAIISGDFSLLPLTEADLPEISSIFAKYHDQQLDLADVCLLHLANRESMDTVFTVDRRHFQLLQKADGSPLTLLPEQL
ncbi:type II toxin-antitoxin system VapC family toxin [Aeoliella mucimassa]|uniref:Ribonuclease VapC26 n=1 Tax=Aeoliella mucimassa TaxID=2527972 RepID=A0A518AQ00_9BACT|nr:PIN domain-containing protein [Aeoliella mucimassa]QDU56793.1 Ribonuclease VapC26 [Aeoliella mucimassa]